MKTLLAVDLGIKTGLALYGEDGRLIWYRSSNFGSTSRLRRGAGAILRDTSNLAWLVLEGGGILAEIWQKEADRRQIPLLQFSAETWRRGMLYPRQQRSGRQAKQHADRLARRVIEWSEAPRPTALRHDTAEAILVGLWGVLQVGWLAELPAAVRI